MLALLTVPAVVASAVAFTGITEVQAKVFPGNAVVRVEGPLAGISSSPLSITPGFARGITDYVLRCAAGTNPIQFTLSAIAGRKLNVLSTVAASVVVQQSLVENQALIVDWHRPNNPHGTQYWIRCLPHDFPKLSASRTGNPPAGWYLTGNLVAVGGDATYAMVLDNYGTPVWYRSSIRPGAVNVTLVARNELAWSGLTNPTPAFQIYDLQSRNTRWLSIPGMDIDFHEYLPEANGNTMLLGVPQHNNVDTTALGGQVNGTVLDCVVMEIDASNQVVWQWRASDHIAVSESTNPITHQPTYDPYHCNSVDVDAASGDVLISLRNADAIYRINKGTGHIVWKLGGNAVLLDQEEHIVVTGDPEGTFHNQHDARFQPGGDISLYDDQSSKPALAARGIEYAVDPISGAATVVWSFQSPDGKNSFATGSFRRLHSGTDNVVAWGFRPGLLFTEVDSSGTVLLNVTFSGGDASYRVAKVSPEMLDHNLLRLTAGLPVALLP